MIRSLSLSEPGQGYPGSMTGQQINKSTIMVMVMVMVIFFLHSVYSPVYSFTVERREEEERERAQRKD